LFTDQTHDSALVLDNFIGFLSFVQTIMKKCKDQILHSLIF